MLPVIVLKEYDEPGICMLWHLRCVALLYRGKDRSSEVISVKL